MATCGKMDLDELLATLNVIGSEERCRQLRASELILVEKTPKVSPNGLTNGGITYATGLDTVRFLADWTEFYKVHYGITVDLSAVPLPPITQGFGWGVVVVPGITVQQVFNNWEKKGVTASKYTDKSLDEVISREKDERNADKGPYISWCRDRRAADEELKNLSANQIAQRGLKTMTLLERELLGEWYHTKTGDHLDPDTYTNCTGSRYSDGDVPDVDFHDGSSKVHVHWYSVGYRKDDLRSREVVALPQAA